MENKPKRRWFSFSLRTLLLLSAIAGAVSAWLVVQANRAEKQRVAVAAIEAAGGRVFYNWHYLTVSRPNPEGPLVWKLNPVPPRQWKRAIGEHYFQEVVHVEIPNLAVSDSVLHHLTRLQWLGGIMLTGGAEEEHPQLRTALPHVQFHADALPSPRLQVRKVF